MKIGEEESPVGSRRVSCSHRNGVADRGPLIRFTGTIVTHEL